MELRILDYIYAFQALTQVSASSSDPEFPVSNLLKTIRSKVWRSSGNFVIDTTNNKIDFKEASGGSVLTATVSSGTYTPATLATAIVTALQAAGTKLYTVSYGGSTGLWTIATTNGTFLSLLWNTGANTAVSIGPSIGFPASSDSTGALTYTGPQIAIHTEEWVLFDLGTTEAIDTVCLFFDAMKDIPFSSSAQLWIQANALNSWSSPSVSQSLTIDTTFDAASYFFGSDQNYRYLRLKIKDPRNANLYVEVSKLALGKATQLSRLPKNGFKFSLMDQSKAQETAYGHRYTDLYPIRKRLDIDYTGLSYSDAQALQSIFQRLGRNKPLVIALDDTGTLYNKNHFLIYGAINTDFQLSHMIGASFQEQVSVLELL